MSLKSQLLDLIVPALAEDAELNNMRGVLCDLIKIIEENHPQPDKAPSEEFERAFGGSGSVSITCGFCGRTHFDSTGEFMEEGELEDYISKQTKNPRAFRGQDGGISWGVISGVQYVHGCPCNEARRYEDVFWTNRRGIMEYLRARIAKRLDAANRDQSCADTLPNKVIL